MFMILLVKHARTVLNLNLFSSAGGEADQKAAICNNTPLRVCINAVGVDQRIKSMYGRTQRR